MGHRIIRSDDDLAECFALLRTLKKPFTMQWRQGADRSLDQNALQFLWANETAQQRGDARLPKCSAIGSCGMVCRSFGATMNSSAHSTMLT